MTGLLLTTMAASAAAATGARAKGKCEMGAASLYPPSLDPLPSGEAKAVEWHAVDLDAAPEDRWRHIVTPLAEGIRKLTDIVVGTLRAILGNDVVTKLLGVFHAGLPGYYAHLPDADFGRELAGIASATGIDESRIFIYNIFYSLFGACTSIVAQDDGGTLVHARNLDFGLWPALNLTDHNFWELTATLRPLVVNVDMRRGGRSLYKHTTFAGFIGAHTAVRPSQLEGRRDGQARSSEESAAGGSGGGFTLTIDSRFDDHLDSAIVRWLVADHSRAGTDGAAEVTMGSRVAIERATSYTAALAYLNATTTLGPSYIILGGAQAGEGAVITKGSTRDGHPFRDEGKTIDLWPLQHELRRSPPRSFLVQTNYDRTGPPPSFDNRRDPAVDCLEHHVGGPHGYTFEGLYNVLSATPNLNKLTTYTSLMRAASGTLEGYRQLCESWRCPLE